VGLPPLLQARCGRPVPRPPRPHGAGAPGAGGAPDAACQLVGVSPEIDELGDGQVAGQLRRRARRARAHY